MPTRRVEFDNGRGEVLSARLEEPPGRARGHALFAHCFTCGKDVKAASILTRALAERGYGVLRFDFTGLGSSEGDFANENFSSNVEDLVAAARYMASQGKPVSLLLGHSLGGAAVLQAAGQLDSVAAVATIAAPADPGHVVEMFDDVRETIDTEGKAQVSLAGRTFTIKKQFLENLEEASLREAVENLRRPLLILHGPLDKIVGIDNASKLFLIAKHPKSFISLDAADHLLTQHEDAIHAAETIAAWASRYVGTEDTRTPLDWRNRPGTVHTKTLATGFRTEVQMGPHAILADEPEDAGGSDAGPSPYDLLLAALGTCTTMTLQMYAGRKNWPLTAAAAHLRHAKVHAKDCAECPDSDAKLDVIERHVELEGDLDEEQRKRLMEIAGRCPVHRTLESKVVVKTSQWSEDR